MSKSGEYQGFSTAVPLESYDWRRGCKKEAQSNDEGNCKPRTEEWGSWVCSGVTTSKVNIFGLSSESSSSSKDSDFSLGWASEAGCFSQDVQMHHATRTVMTPPKDPMRERVTVLESSKHWSKKATRKETMLILGKKKVRQASGNKADEITHLHISNAYGKLNMMARVSNPSRGWALFLKKFT